MNNVMFSGPIAWFYHVMISFYSCSNGTFFLLNSSPGGHSSDVRSQLRKYWNLSFIFCFSKLILRAWWSWTLLQPKLLRHYYSQIDKDSLRKLSRLYQVILPHQESGGNYIILWKLMIILYASKFKLSFSARLQAVWLWPGVHFWDFREWRLETFLVAFVKSFDVIDWWCY